MEFAAAAKLILLFIWPVFVLLIFYFKDKEKFKQKMKKMLDRR